MVESFSLTSRLVRNIEQLIEETGLYSSKSEFYREAVREKFLELEKREKAKEEMRKVREKFARKLKSKNKTPSIPTKEERAEIADNYLKEKNLSEIFRR